MDGRDQSQRSGVANQAYRFATSTGSRGPEWVKCRHDIDAFDTPLDPQKIGRSCRVAKTFRVPNCCREQSQQHAFTDSINRAAHRRGRGEFLSAGIPAVAADPESSKSGNGELQYLREMRLRSA